MRACTGWASNARAKGRLPGEKTLALMGARSPGNVAGGFVAGYCCELGSKPGAAHQTREDRLKAVDENCGSEFTSHPTVTTYPISEDAAATTAIL